MPVSNPDNLWKSPLLVLWRHWMHLNAMHPVMSENQFHCTRLRVCVCHNERKCQTNGKHDKRYRRYFKLTPITQIYRERNSNETETDTRGFWGMRGCHERESGQEKSDAATACAKHGCGSRAHVRRGAQGLHARER